MKSIIRHIYRSLSAALQERHIHFIKSLLYLTRKRRLNLARIDFVRLSCLELAADEIYACNISGSVAELGVYKGDFAVDINLVFPDKKLYLFDTFEGFNSKDKDTELKKSYSSALQDFSDTSAEKVLNRMPFAQNCVI